jgi:hypothetical protein
MITFAHEKISCFHMIKNVRKVLILSGKIFLLFILLMVLIFTIKYITCPVYNFPEPEPFSGDKYYNPYENLKTNQWKKANFQVQSYAWSGITSGRGNTNEEIYETYKSLGYDVIATSDYQKINRFRENQDSYIPVYEHGYGIKKNHQVLIGAGVVMWKDYPIFQTIHNKQNILNLLAEDNELVYIAHPKLRHGYQPENMKWLSNYDGIEVLNNYRTSLEHWDAALSAGKYVSILGNDDAHDISNPDEIGHHCTFINSPTNHREDILEALKSNRAFGAKIWRPHGESLEEKINRTRHLPQILDVKLLGDTLMISCDSIVKAFRFIGQNGQLLKSVGPSDSAFYVIGPQDTYVRIELEFENQTVYYLNPIARYVDEIPNNKTIPEINVMKTAILRVVGFATLIFLALNYFIIRKRIKSRKSR